MDPLDMSSLTLDAAIEREWLCVNHIGGYASSTIVGMNTRKYHGLLVAAMSPPVRRMVILSRVEEFVGREGWRLPLCNSEYPGVIHPDGHRYLRAFNPDPFPRWAWQAEGWTVEKQLCLLEGRNAVCLSYVLVGSDRPLELELSPLFALRPIHELMYQWNGRLRAERNENGAGMQIPATGRTPEVFFQCDGHFESRPLWYLNTIYRREQDRGYGGLEDVWTPGTIRWTLQPGTPVHFVCATEPIDFQAAVSECNRHVASGSWHTADATHGSLLHAARQFELNIDRAIPATTDAGKRRSADQSLWTGIMSLYPWGSVRGRSAMVAMHGLLLCAGRLDEARRLLFQYVDSLRNGLMPSNWPEDGSPPTYRGADIALWFINAAWHYLRYHPNDPALRRAALSTLRTMVLQYQRGTELGIRLDADGLIESDTAGEASTWMDVRLGDWIITPRQGKAVEINALWYNALRIGQQWAGQSGESAAAGNLSALADQVKDSFNRLFWNEPLQCCHDVVRGDKVDSAIRPNQIFAASLPFTMLDQVRCASVLNIVLQKLLTPAGLRTLSPDDPDYHGRYAGSVVARDRAHHQGSVFPWLLGPLADALLRVHGRTQETRRRIADLIDMPLNWIANEGMGQLCELFDGDAPHHGGGGPADAKSLAEILRIYVEIVLDQRPASHPMRAYEQSVATLVLPPIQAPQ